MGFESRSAVAGSSAVFWPGEKRHTSFRRWTKSGLWEALLTAVCVAERDDEYLMIDRTSSKIH